MKVLFVAFGRDETLGGGTRITFELAKALSKKGIEIGILLPGNNTEVFTKDGITYITIKSLNLRNTIAQLSFKTIKKISTFIDEFNPDIVHAHTLSNIGLIGQYWANKNNRPFIFTAHEMPSDLGRLIEGTGFLISKVGKGIVRSFVKYYILNSDAVISLTEYEKSDLNKLGFKNKIGVIPNGRDLRSFTKLKYPNVLDSEIKLIFTGVVCKDKNQKFLVNVLKYLPSKYSLYLVGSVIEKPYKKSILKNLPKEVAVRVHFLGQVDFKKIPGYLEDSHVFVTASKYEVFSLSMLEALAAGKPVVMLNEKSTASWVPSGVEIVNASPRIFAQKILEIVNVPQEEYNSLCNKMRDSVTQYSLENTLNQTIEFYKSVALDFKIKPKAVRDTIIKRILDLIVKNTPKNLKTKTKIPKLGKEEVIIGSFMAASVILYTGIKYLNKLKDTNSKANRSKKG